MFADTMQMMITDALTEYAQAQRRESRSRRYAGPQHAGARELRRETARDAELLAGQVSSCDPVLLASALMPAPRGGRPPAAPACSACGHLHSSTAECACGCPGWQGARS